MLVDVGLLGASLVDVDRDVLTLAVCAHDVVYNGRPGEDERASAAWARSHLLDASVHEQVVARVEKLVLATITHESDGDLLADILLDADLAILGASEEQYDAYVRAVRAEYAHVPDEHWRVGRSAVLRGLVDREVIYRTADARRRWDSAARSNMRRELAAI
ncbi:hypothetical protein NLX83_07620 [Allokutzneria sp. A3M-2-11 16]|uniref:HD domain-containing protein n=1 Tax=Allokutzneria sp. A3M-2-11 16 TaxID=2962043 RepID=UPI0020B64A8C|nr:hypothetical protein [Allokutzneria sp. A3M-2-11 16]MCP3799121.1 hypothetical protein [Allokutzneria sp. A3M-2-11 16]